MTRRKALLPIFAAALLIAAVAGCLWYLFVVVPDRIVEHW